MNEQEIYKDIPGYEGLYQASDLGNIKSLIKSKRYGGNERILVNKFRNKKKRQCYMFVTLCKDGIKKHLDIHRLVLSTFLGESSLDGNHINGIKADNRLENLEWITRQENIIHSFKNGLQVCKKGEDNANYGSKSKNAKSIIQLDLNNNFLNKFECIADAKRFLGIGKSNGGISDVCRGIRNSSGGFIWKYS